MCYSFLADLNQLSPCESEPCVLCRRCFASFCVVYHPLFACSMCKCPCQLVFHSCLGNLQEDVNKDMFVDKLNLIITFFSLGNHWQKRCHDTLHPRKFRKCINNWTWKHFSYTKTQFTYENNERNSYQIVFSNVCTYYDVSSKFLKWMF